MGMSSHHERLLTVRSLMDFFRESVSAAIESQGVEINPHTSHYVVNLLTLFARSEELYEDDGETYGLKPLALMLADAASARRPVDLSATSSRRMPGGSRLQCRSPMVSSAP